MNHSRTVPTQKDPAVLIAWSARRIRPIVLVGVILVFAVFAAVAHFAFHSPEAVKALGMACLGSLGGLFVNVAMRFEYRLTETGLDKRARRAQNPPDFKPLFAWEELDRVVPTRHGFKYYRPIPDGPVLGRFWKRWLSDRYSGEAQIEPADREAVLGEFRRRGFIATDR